MPDIIKPPPKVTKKGGKSASKDTEVQYWERRLNLAERKLKDKGGDMKRGADGTRGWRGLINFYQGQQWRPGMAGKDKTFDRITANQAKSNIDSIRPQLYFQNPRIHIALKNPQLAESDIPEVQMTPMGPQPVMQPGPTDPMTGQPTPVPVIRIPKGTPIATVNGQVVDAQEQIDLLTAVDNYYFEETNAKVKIKRVVNDALILPYGVAKWEWVVEIDKEEETDPATGEPTGKKVEKVSRQYAKLTRIKPWCFIWDTELDEFDISEAAWVAEIKYVTKEELEGDEQLDISDMHLPDPTYYIDDFDHNYRRTSDRDSDMGRYKLYEIHDLRRGEFLVWLEGSPKINRHDTPSPYAMVEGSIYTALGFDETPDDSFPLSQIDQIKSKAEAYNKIRSYQVNHVARFNRKYKRLKGAMDEPELEKWERGEDGTCIEVKDMNMGPEPIKDAEINVDSYKVADDLKNEMREDIGVTAMMKGTRETGVDTAFEANLIQGGSDIKIQEKRDTVRNFCKDLLRKLNQILKEYADTPTIVEIAGQKGKKWVSWTNNDIKGEFLEDVDIYSTLPYSEDVDKKQAMEMYSLAGADPMFDGYKVRQQLVRVFKWPDDVLLSEQDFQARMMAQQQQASMQQAQQENQKQQSRSIRPTEGQVRRGPDMQAGIMGAARNAQ